MQSGNNVGIPTARNQLGLVVEQWASVMPIVPASKYSCTSPPLPSSPLHLPSPSPPPLSPPPALHPYLTILSHLIRAV